MTQGDCVSQGKWSDLAVGMEPDGWVVAGEEICGAFVKKTSSFNIQVLLKGTQKGTVGAGSRYRGQSYTIRYRMAESNPTRQEVKFSLNRHR